MFYDQLQKLNFLVNMQVVKDILSYSPAWTPQTILYAIIAFLWTIYFWETYLAYRQHCLAKKTASVPPELAGVMDQVTYNKARDYHMDKSKFHFVCTAWEQIFQTIVLAFGGIPWLWFTTESITAHFGYGRQNEIIQSVVFALLGSLLSTVIELPFSFYSTFVLEERHGFNKQTVGFFAKDKLKMLIVMDAIMVPVLACIVHIIRIGGEYFFVYLWLFCCAVTLVFVTVYADYIAPLFDTFVPLEEGALRAEIELLAHSINFPLTKIFVVEGSKRSAHSNAYFYGFYKNKRIVLFDTLLKESPFKKEEPKEVTASTENGMTGCSQDEVIAVLAHEFGHWKFNHTLKNLGIIQVNLLLMFAVFALLHQNQTLYAVFGFPDQMPLVVGFYVIMQYVCSPYNEVLSLLMTMLSRRHEFQADLYAKMLNRAADLRAALVKLNKDNLGYPVYDWLYSAYHHSHPPLLQRIRALGKIE